MPAAAVIPALIAYINIVAVKKSVVDKYIKIVFNIKIFTLKKLE